MKPPRRIFRNTIAARSNRVGRTVLMGLCIAGVTSAVVMGALSSSLFGHVSAEPEQLRADAGQVAVIGGDTLRLDGRVVRLSGVDAPDRGDTCRNGADCGGAATAELARLVRDRRVECRLSGHDPLGRPFGDCVANGVDLSSAIVASGWGRAREDRPSLANLELRARQHGAGLWATLSP